MLRLEGFTFELVHNPCLAIEKVVNGDIRCISAVRLNHGEVSVRLHVFK